jgi:hypothetical protein
MKKYLIICSGVVCTLFIMAIFVNQMFAQTSKTEGGKAIPENIVKIADRSCVKCHAEPGSAMALSHLNITKWDKYSPEKQAAKAKDMCTQLTKDKMPPKKFRDKNPGAAPTKDEIKIFCDWAQSLQPPAKK